MAFNTSQNQALIETGLGNASRGQDGNKAYGELFQGLGQSFSNALNAFDQTTRVKIETEAYKGVENAVGANMPPALKDGLTSIESLQQARNQGTISETKFLTDLTVLSKKLRGQFPSGYAPLVDRAIQTATGASTANDLRKARLSEIDSALAANAAMQEEERKRLEKESDELGKAVLEEKKNMREWTETAENSALFFDATVQQHFKTLSGGVTVEQFLADPTLELFPKLKIAVAQRKGMNANADRIKLEIETKNRIREDQASDLTDEFVSNAFNTEINKDYGNYITAKATASDPNSPGGATWTVAEAEQVAQVFQKFRLAAIDNTEKFFAGTKVTDDVREKLRKRVNTILDAHQEALTNGQMGLLNAAKRANEGNFHAAIKELMGSSDVFASVILAKEAGLPPEVINSLFINEENRKVIKEQLLSPTILGILSGKNSVGDSLDTIDKYEDNMAPVTKGLMDQLSFALNTPVNTPEGVANAALNLFAEKNNDLLSRISKNSRSAVFEQLLSPVVIQKLKASGNQEALDFATNWGTKQFDIITKRARDTAVDAAKYRIFMDVKFDGQKFTVVPRERTWGEFMTQIAPPSWESDQEKEASAAVADINRYMAVMKPLWEAQGLDPSTAMAYMLEDINQVQKNPTFLLSVGAAMWNYIGGSEAKASTPKDGEKSVVPGSSLPDRDASQILGFISKAEGADYRTLFGGSKIDLENMTVAEVQQMQRQHGKKTGSSATGAYQVMRKTLSGLIDAGVVDPDEKFTVEVQDRIGMALLKGRGYDDWKSGRLTTEEFADRLAKEWASLPTSSGKSYYDGDKMGNKATKSRQTLINSLEAIRNG